jgi:peptidoglycan biosynthesis protein MviN/MurJ (putative lipid II flippase)
MFPLDRLAIVGSSVQRVEDLGFGPLPDAVRLLPDGPPRLGVVGLALGAALSSWVEYRILRGALQWRIGKLPRASLAARWSLLAAVAAGVLAAGLRSVTEDLPRLVAAVVVFAPAVGTYLLITATVAVPEASAIVARVRLRR